MMAGVFLGRRIKTAINIPLGHQSTYDGGREQLIRGHEVLIACCFQRPARKTATPLPRKKSAVQSDRAGWPWALTCRVLWPTFGPKKYRLCQVIYHDVSAKKMKNVKVLNIQG